MTQEEFFDKFLERWIAVTDIVLNMFPTTKEQQEAIQTNRTQLMTDEIELRFQKLESEKKDLELKDIERDVRIRELTNQINSIKSS